MFFLLLLIDKESGGDESAVGYSIALRVGITNICNTYSVLVSLWNRRLSKRTGQRLVRADGKSLLLLLVVGQRERFDMLVAVT